MNYIKGKKCKEPRRRNDLLDDWVLTRTTLKTSSSRASSLQVGLVHLETISARLSFFLIWWGIEVLPL